MRNIYKFLALSAAIFALSFVNVNAQDFSAETPTKFIEQEVQKKILRLPYYEVFDHITVSMDGDTVILNGKVRNAINKNAAAAEAKRVDGVANVINNIEILSPGSFDESIRMSIYSHMHHVGALSRYLQNVNPAMRIIVDRGHVTLEGFVANQSDANMARIAALSVPGSFSVTNNLVVDRERAG
ncbi:MAG TPA: BON domain-containing protein [Pyrinomonadaceae bacterium]|nr:BON domain-containing protein [Pyrinomonadaceae bacterium]